ncbi:MAG: MMPL family transporter [Actinomycetota bacterium]
MGINPERLARASAKRPWLTVGLWVVLLTAAGFVTSQFLGDALTNDFDFTNEPESVRARELISERLRGPETLSETYIVQGEELTVDDPAFEEQVQDLQSDLTGLGPDLVQATFSFYDTEDPSMVSDDQHSTLVTAVLPDDIDLLTDHVEELRSIAQDHSGSGFETLVIGDITVSDDFNTIAEEDLAKGESFGIGAALIVLIVVFGAIVAALLPIFLAIGAIVLAVGAVAFIGQWMDFSFFVTNMITMMGLAVGIDYSLFIVSRYREERAHGLDKLAAISAAGATANRAVFFSGMTVVLALIGLLLIPTTIFMSLGLGAILVVLAAVLASMTLLPAILSLLGDRVNSLRILGRKKVPGAPPRDGGFWDRITHAVMSRPVVALVLAAGLLVAAGWSYFDMNTGFAGVSTGPDDMPTKRAYAVLASEFSGGFTSPVEIAIDGDAAGLTNEVAELQDLLADDEGFGPSTVETNEASDLTLVSAPVAGDPSGEAATTAVERVREEYVPAVFGGSDIEVLVGGATAFNKDFFDLTDTYTPIVFAFVLGLSFLLLTVVFRSIVVPVKAILMNLLSVGAAYGLIVLVFQKGVGADLLGFQQVEAIEAWLPLFLFSILFGLSMDYHVFLLTRIREHWDLTGDNTGSVAHGLRTTGQIITGAALIMVAVFAGFAAGDLAALQQMGFGLAVAVFLDATIVRSILVPAAMKLLGDRNWYLPKWLRWLPDIHVEGSAAAKALHAREEREEEPVLTG